MRVPALTLAIVFGLSAARAADWPQYRGPARDGVSAETGLRKSWPEGGPARAWTFDKTGIGYSGPAIVGDRLYITGARGDTEYLIALDIAGAAPRELWSAKIGPLFEWKGNNWNAGPNASPTVAGGAGYALGGRGDLICCEASGGKERWRKNLPRDLGGEVNPIGGGLEEPTPLGWGYACAPLVDGDRVIVAPGGPRGLLAALDAKTGATVWQSKEVTDKTSYASPVVATIAGVRQYVHAVNAGLVGINAADGKRLWTYTRPAPFDDCVISTPVVHDDLVFASVGFSQGCDLVRVSKSGDGWKADAVFSNKSVENRDGGMVLVDGRLYGHSENVGWFCNDFKTGKSLWSEKRKLGQGAIVAADGMLYCQAEADGTVVLIEAKATGWTERGRLKLPQESSQRKPSGKVWTHPAIANGRLYLRDQELLFCFDLRGK
jgi:outer membrane protein assembly factor BamB